MTTYKLVPVEPTTEMVIAAYQSQGEATSLACEQIYRATLAAAPQAPASAPLVDKTANLQGRAEAPKGDPVALARAFHEAYERLAPSFGYETRPETREFDPDSPNGRLMVAVCASLTTPQPKRLPLTDEEIRAERIRTGNGVGFMDGVRFAEQAHGITGEAE